MGSAKSAKLLVTAYNYEETGRHVVVTKPLTDTRDKNHITSRTGMRREIDFLTTPEMNIEEEVMRRRELAREANKDINALLVDEAQFLTLDQIDELLNLAVIRSIPVLAYGLNSDFQTKGFPASDRLMIASHVLRESITLCADEDCDSKARWNARKVNGVYVTTGEQVAIDDGGEVAYNSLCDTHYINYVGPIKH